MDAPEIAFVGRSNAGKSTCINTLTQQKRLAKLQASKLTRWRVTAEDRWLARNYRRVERAFEQTLAATEQASCMPEYMSNIGSISSMRFVAGRAS